MPAKIATAGRSTRIRPLALHAPSHAASGPSSPISSAACPIASRTEVRTFSFGPGSLARSARKSSKGKAVGTAVCRSRSFGSILQCAIRWPMSIVGGAKKPHGSDRISLHPCLCDGQRHRLLLRLRSDRDEIGAWIGMTPEARRAVMALLPARLAVIERKAAPRNAQVEDGARTQRGVSVPKLLVAVLLLVACGLGLLLWNDAAGTTLGLDNDRFGRLLYLSALVAMLASASSSRGDGSGNAGARSRFGACSLQSS